MGRALLLVVFTALWLGAAIIVATVVAPAAFAVLPSRMMAGALVGRVLPAVFLSGCVIALVNAALDATDPTAAGATLRIAASVIWGACCAAAQFIVTPRIDRLRATAAGPIDALAPDSPVRAAFGRLHGISAGLLLLAMFAALLVLILAGRTIAQKG
jgi:hypothetical protein